MIRIALAPVLDSVWLGGLNYYRNLFASLAKLNHPEFEFRLFTSPDANCAWLPNWPGLQVVRCESLRRGSVEDLVRRMAVRFIGRDRLLEKLLIRSKAALLSHSGFLAGCKDVATVGWIADLQHRHLPQLFSRRELKVRDQSVRDHLQYCDRILVSSADAQEALQRFDAGLPAKVSVLRFVADVPRDDAIPPPGVVQRKYNLPGRYFYLPNQFWVHKNHSVVVDAVKLLAQRSQPVCVVCTGHTKDYRQPDYFAALMSRVAGFEANFRVLGVVSSDESFALMRDAVAVINPSRFEGWSTTVEESKSFGKCVLLSDIPVHREQAPKRGVFFDPTQAEELASRLREIGEQFDPAAERSERDRALETLDRRQIEFAGTYIGILRDTLERRNP